MARRVGKLTALAVAQARRRGYYSDGGGLFLQVGASGNKSWVFRFRQGGRLREMGLGPLHTIGLAEARQKALDCRRARLDGRDPIADRHATRIAAKVDAAKAMTFRQCAEHYIAAHKAGWRNPKHAAQWGATLETYVYPHVGALPVAAIETGLVLKTIEPIWLTKPETASRVRGRIETVLDYAAARKWRAEGENPARWRGHLDKLLPKPTKAKRAVRQVTGRQEHHAALPYAGISAFMGKLRAQEGISVRALEFAILTAGRTSEIIGARWEEFDLAEKVWTIPAARMKAGKEHRVPLSDDAMVIIEQMGRLRQGDYLFPGSRDGRPLSNMALLMTLRRMGRGDLTVHGFRSTFRDWAAERTSFPAEVAEMALAHTVGDKVEAAYRRGDLFQKRRQLAEAWGRFCEVPTSDKVVHLPAKAAGGGRRRG